MFLNRITELELLERRFASDKAELFVLYGRRRVGKTDLLTHFCQDKRHIFFVADLSAERMLRAGFSAAVNGTLFGPEQANAVYGSWEDIFVALAAAAQSERLVVVIDEFPYLVAAYPAIASILQRIWDHTLKHSQMMLILCGSYIGMMEETVLGYKAPLYGRRTGQYLLEPLQFVDAQAFFPGYDASDRVRTYAVYGGTPAYLQAIDPRRSLEANIRDSILTRGAFLYDEVRFVLQQELREPRNYFAILQAIAGGRTQMNEIKQVVGLEGVSAYLETLQQLHLVERVVPVTETQPYKSRRGLYRLKDHFLRFWFRFAHPNWSQLEQGAGAEILARLVMPQIDLFTGPVFEDVCQQFLWRAGQAQSLPLAPQRIGGWWQANEEVDLVVLADDQALLVECKWTARAVGVDILQDLERKARLMAAELGNRQIFYGLCARAGFTEQLQEMAGARGDVWLFGLDRLLGR